MISIRKSVGMRMLAALVLFGASLVAVHGQEPASSPKQQQQAQPSQPQPTPQIKQLPKNPGIGRQLAHETREAAGEEKDETAEFKQSPSVRLVSRLTGLDLRSAYWLCVLTNFVVIAVVIIWAARKYMPGAFRARTEAIQKAMQEAQKASEEARRRLVDIESRLTRLDAEIGAMRDAAEKEAVAEEGRIQVAAQEDARKIVAAAEQEIAAAAKAARRQLTAHAADLAVALAQKQIHVDASTDQALVRNFAGQLSVASENAGKDGH